MRATQELPGPWVTTFFDFRDPETGHRSGVIQQSRVIAMAPCIGCRIHLTNPEDAVTLTYEVWAGGEREEDRVGCLCDEQEEAGFTAWRKTPIGSLAHRDRVCSRCGGYGGRDSKTNPLRRIGCSACGGTGWKDGIDPFGEAS